MSVRVTNLSSTVVDGSGAAVVGTTVTFTLQPPSGAGVLLDTSGEVIDTTPLVTTTNGSGVFSQNVIAPGDITPVGSTWLVTYLNTRIISPSFAYSASPIDPSSWLPGSITNGLLKMYLTDVGGDAVDVQSAPMVFNIAQNTTWTGGAGVNQNVDTNNNVTTTTDSSGNVYVYLIPTSQMTPNNTYYNCTLPSGTILTFTCPTIYNGWDISAWASGNTYALNDYVQVTVSGVTTTYISIQAANTNHAPASSPLWWSVSTTMDKGIWSSATTYYLNDIVEVNGVPYVSIQTANTNHIPASSGSWWQLYIGERVTAHLTSPVPASQSFATTSNIPHDTNVVPLPDDPVQSPTTLSDDLLNLNDRTENELTSITATTYTVLSTDDRINSDATTGNTTITLEAATARRKPTTIQKTDNTSHTITVTPNGTDTINGAATYVLTAQYQAVVLNSDGVSNYNVTSEVPALSLSLPTALFANTGNTLVGKGSLTDPLATQSANTVFSGPSSGSAATPTFRTLVPLDIPTSWATKTTTYTITTVNSGILGDATGAGFTVTLPTAVGATQDYAIKKVDSSTNVLTVGTTSSQYIDGATTYALSAQYQGIVVRSNGSNWYIVAEIGIAGFSNPMTTKGDIIIADTGGVPTRLAAGTNTYVLTSNGAGTFPSWQSGGGGGGKTPTVLLDYTESTDVDSIVSIPANTWTDVNANQSFTVASTTDVIQVCIQHGMQFLAGSGTPRVAMQAVFNSAGTPVIKKYSSSDASAAVEVGSPPGGSFYLAASTLPAGASTIKLQIFSTTAGTLDIKASTLPDTEFIQIQVIEFE